MSRRHDFELENEELKTNVSDSIADIKDQLGIIRDVLTEEQLETLTDELTTIDSQLKEIEENVKSANNTVFNFFSDFLKYAVEVNNYGDYSKKQRLIEELANANGIQDLPTTDYDLI